MAQAAIKDFSANIRVQAGQYFDGLEAKNFINKFSAEQIALQKGSMNKDATFVGAVRNADSFGRGFLNFIKLVIVYTATGVIGAAAYDYFKSTSSEEAVAALKAKRNVVAVKMAKHGAVAATGMAFVGFAIYAVKSYIGEDLKVRAEELLDKAKQDAVLITDQASKKAAEAVAAATETVSKAKQDAVLITDKASKEAAKAVAAATETVSKANQEADTIVANATKFKASAEAFLAKADTKRRIAAGNLTGFETLVYNASHFVGEAVDSAGKTASWAANTCFKGSTWGQNMDSVKCAGLGTGVTTSGAATVFGVVKYPKTALGIVASVAASIFSAYAGNLHGSVK